MTSNHSIYSADRLDFVPAGELRVGETLRNLEGNVRIESIEQLGSEERVYNLEIHGEHVFRVASSGVLVHNSSGADGSKGPVHIDIGGEGRYPNAINVNPNTTTSTTGTAGRTIPNHVPGRGERLPFGARNADGISLENAPITAQTAAEIARVIKPGGSIRLVSPSDYAAAAHKRVIDSISGCNVQQSTVNGITTTTITVPR